MSVCGSDKKEIDAIETSSIDFGGCRQVSMVSRSMAGSESGAFADDARPHRVVQCRELVLA